ncbi:MAG TPA: 7TM diverse intracellular signaling domain-containing protein [Cytophagales bacterium]|nr:7TM diverse intracellular signaling domain-containing protein [Cytophagales bacterium]
MILFFWVFLLSAFAPGAPEIINYTHSKEELEIGKSIYLLEDKEGTLDFNDILKDSIQNQFKLSEENIPNYGNTQSVVWVRFTVSNTSAERCFVEIVKPLIHKITFFYPDSTGQYQSRTTGANYSFYSREWNDNDFIFTLLHAHTPAPHTFYFRFDSDESLEIPLIIGSEETLFERHTREELLYGMYIGFMILMFLYNLMIYFRIKEKVYLLYSLYVISMLLLIDMMMIGKGFQYIWPSIPYINFQINGLTALVGTFMIFFTAAFLKTKENTPLLHKGFYFLLFVNLAIIILNISGDYFVSSIACQIITLVLTLYLIFTAVSVYRKGFTPARYYLVAYATLFVGGFLYILYMNNLVPYSFFTKNAPLIGSVGDIVLLSFALADNISRLRKEKITLITEKLDLIESQKQKLERMVQERTEEIATQNEELRSQQEQIHFQKEELQVRNIKLELARIKIEERNHQLNLYTQNLEREIESRSSELVKSNQELIDQNHQMEQFSFITAHNLRSPVARIQGLCEVLGIVKENEKPYLLEQLMMTSKDLDRVIHDLTKILEIRKGSSQNFDWIDLEEKTVRALSILEDEIKQSKGVVKYNFEQAKQVYGLSAYIESILYNLISNAIKYRSPERPPIIEIESKIQDRKIHIFINDNGIGIDLDKYKGKVFGIYKRFHTHVEGKGLGLHLVKTQVQAMYGNIKISSTPNKGTTFEITFPLKDNNAD